MFPGWFAYNNNLGKPPEWGLVASSGGLTTVANTFSSAPDYAPPWKISSVQKNIDEGVSCLQAPVIAQLAQVQFLLFLNLLKKLDLEENPLGRGLNLRVLTLHYSEVVAGAVSFKEHLWWTQIVQKSSKCTLECVRGHMLFVSLRTSFTHLLWSSLGLTPYLWPFLMIMCSLLCRMVALSSNFSPPYLL